MFIIIIMIIIILLLLLLLLLLIISLYPVGHLRVFEAAPLKRHQAIRSRFCKEDEEE